MISGDKVVYNKRLCAVSIANLYEYSWLLDAIVGQMSRHLDRKYRIKLKLDPLMRRIQYRIKLGMIV